jgi:hypothetical protein
VSERIRFKRVVDLSRKPCCIRLVPYSLDGFTANLPWFSAQWKKKKSDKKIAQTVIIFLEDRRVIFGQWTGEVPEHCITSVFEIRAFLREQLLIEDMGDGVGDVLRLMLAVCRRFIDAAGHEGENFTWRRRHTGGLTLDAFAVALGALRSSIGFCIAILADRYGIKVHGDLTEILPPRPEIDAIDVRWRPPHGGWWLREHGD